MTSKEKLKWMRKSALEVARLQLERIFQERFEMMFLIELRKLEDSNE